jgi:hypothetical protein
VLAIQEGIDKEQQRIDAGEKKSREKLGIGKNKGRQYS